MDGLGLLRQAPHCYAFSVENLLLQMEQARRFLNDAQASLNRLQADPRTDAANLALAHAFVGEARAALDNANARIDAARDLIW